MHVDLLMRVDPKMCLSQRALTGIDATMPSNAVRAFAVSLIANLQRSDQNGGAGAPSFVDVDPCSPDQGIGPVGQANRAEVRLTEPLALVTVAVRRSD